MASFTGEVKIIKDKDGKEIERVPQVFVDGVPARDLSADDWGSLSDAEKLRVANSGIYSLTAEEQTEVDALKQEAE